MGSKIKALAITSLAVLCTCGHIDLDAAIIYRDGKFMDANDVSTLPLEEHYNLGIAAFNIQDWKEASKQFRIVTLNFPQVAFASETYYYLGIAYYNLEELDFANEAFNCYLKSPGHPKYFQDAVEYKLAIADMFAGGAKKRLLGYKKLPKWMPATSMAIEIYDEIISILPCHELAAQALYAKGCYLYEKKDYRESADTFQILIRRFPKHELTPESYLAINRIYLKQCQSEFQNPDIITLAQINTRKFKQAFPREERVAQAEADVMAIKEIYARGLYEIGRFYERTKKPKASIIYYENAISQFPDTAIAQLCRDRLCVLQGANT